MSRQVYDADYPAGGAYKRTRLQSYGMLIKYF